MKQPGWGALREIQGRWEVPGERGVARPAADSPAPELGWEPFIPAGLPGAQRPVEREGMVINFGRDFGEGPER